MNNFNIVGNHILFNSYFKEVYGAWTKRPTSEQASRYNAFANKLTAIGALQDLSCFYIYLNTNFSDNLFNWINPTKYKCIPYGNINFNSGSYSIQGDGTTAYLDTQFNPSLDASRYTLNDCFYGVLCSSGINGSNVQIGVADATYRADLIHRSGGSTRVFCNSTVQNQSSGAGNITNAVVSVQRISSTQYEYRRSYGGGAGLVSQNSAGVPNQTFYLLALNNNGTASTYSVTGVSIYAAFIGKCTFDVILFNKLLAEFVTNKNFS